MDFLVAVFLVGLPAVANQVYLMTLLATITLRRAASFVSGCVASLWLRPVEA